MVHGFRLFTGLLFPPRRDSDEGEKLMIGYKIVVSACFLEELRVAEDRRIWNNWGSTKTEAKER